MKAQTHLRCVFGSSNGRTSWGLRGVNLEEMKSPKEMFWAAAFWEDVFFPEHAPHLDHNGQACDDDNHDGGDNDDDDNDNDDDDDDDYKRKATTSCCGREER